MAGPPDQRLQGAYGEISPDLEVVLTAEHDAHRTDRIRQTMAPRGEHGPRAPVAPFDHRQLDPRCERDRVGRPGHVRERSATARVRSVAPICAIPARMRARMSSISQTIRNEPSSRRVRTAPDSVIRCDGATSKVRLQSSAFTRSITPATPTRQRQSLAAAGRAIQRARRHLLRLAGCHAPMLFCISTMTTRSRPVSGMTMRSRRAS